jgi:hypothetical protein
MKQRPPLSQTRTGRSWVAQFRDDDKVAAATLLDEIRLFNEEEVSTTLRSLLHDLAKRERKSKRKIGLYAEREFEGLPFDVKPVPDRAGVLRQRAVGFKGPLGVEPIRGGRRVGSEGPVSFVIAQATQMNSRFANQPGPDHIRGVAEGTSHSAQKSKPNPIGTLAIVTDFIGSGTRVRSMLSNFWAVPSVRSWASLGLIKFVVIAATGTSKGVEALQDHRLTPEVLVEHIVPTLAEAQDLTHQRWRLLSRHYGPDLADGVSRDGYKGTAALVAFSYGIPNNAPAFIAKNGNGWKALFTGPAPADLRAAFGYESPRDRVSRHATATRLPLAPDITVSDAMIAVVLGAVRGRWRPNSAVGLAEMTSLTTREVSEVEREALAKGLLNGAGRLTDYGQKFLGAASRLEHKRPTIPTNSKPYYPSQLRTSRRLSSTRRSPERPR